MNKAVGCPSVEELKELLLGRVPDSAAAKLEQHLAECQRCLETLHVLEAEDALVANMRKQAARAPRPEKEVVDNLIRQLKELPAENVGSRLEAALAAGQTDADSDCTMPEQAGLAESLPQVPGYEVLGVLGRGGMGVVYKARHLKLKRLVALKMILAGSHAGAGAMQRFHTEAQAVARLQHPGIVQIHEIGETDLGTGAPCPYMALEFVEAGSLAARLDGTPLSPEAAARLTALLAQAVQAAHEQGILHRDLKPANVFLTATTDPSGVPVEERSGQDQRYLPKIGDFGLAKKLDDKQGQTQSGLIIGTPSYMAPEQAEGKSSAMGPGVDVYALGAILYDLLTGRPPFRSATTLETLKQVISAEPVPPSRLSAGTPRDLETVCLKCLRKDPARRYGSARALAEDLERFLNGEPIVARPVGAWERGVKWARRRPAVAALVTLALLAALGLVSGGLWHNAQLRDSNAQLGAALQTAEDRRKEAQREFERAEANFAKALATVDEMVNWVGQDRLANIPHMVKARRDILEKALKSYQAFLQETSADPRVRQQTAFAYARMGGIYRTLGQRDQAEKAYAKAQELQSELVADFPNAASYRRDLADTFHNRSISLKNDRRYREAIEDGRRALAAYQKLADDYPLDPVYRKNLANAWNHLGVLLASTGERQKAEEAYQKALSLQERLAADDQDNPAYRHPLALSYNNLGHLLAGAPGREHEAEDAYRKALELQEKLTADFDVADYRQDLAGSYHNLSTLLIHGKRPRPHEGEKALGRAIELRQKLADDFPDRPEYRLNLGQSQYQRCVLLWGTGRPTEAEEVYAEALAAYEKLVTDFPFAPAFRDNLAFQNSQVLGNLLRISLSRGGEKILPQAERIFRKNVALTEKLTARFPDLQGQLANHLDALATLRHHQGDLAEARRLLERAIRHAQAFRKANPLLPAARRALADHYAKLANILVLLKEHAAAATAVSEMPRISPDGWQDCYHAAALLARCAPLAEKDTMLSAPQRKEQAHAYGDQAVKLLRDAIGKGFKGGDELQKNSSFDPLRSRDDFKQLLKELGPKIQRDR